MDQLSYIVGFRLISALASLQTGFPFVVSCELRVSPHRVLAYITMLT